ncbi:hypothetical protein B0H17DRAFT_1150832 [Mycena rosella]|uniref:Uncharacterized protein n=1 Tax=Mycena rosella TaxID=1033263 RepID=A0AAD7BR19_MYCRO|nr:hypothetical protein B0H17DRAFT_1150832 [Mycena rosella]
MTEPRLEGEPCSTIDPRERGKLHSLWSIGQAQLAKSGVRDAHHTDQGGTGRSEGPRGSRGSGRPTRADIPPTSSSIKAPVATYMAAGKAQVNPRSGISNSREIWELRGGQGRGQLKNTGEQLESPGNADRNIRHQRNHDGASVHEGWVFWLRERQHILEYCRKDAGTSTNLNTTVAQNTLISRRNFDYYNHALRDLSAHRELA